ncbi:MAG: PQQ-dependent sugar dehydrogenase, partial [Planctomycetales bacterium]
MKIPPRCLQTALLLLGSGLVSVAQADPNQAVHGLKLEEGLQAAVFAAEPLVMNPVSFWLDHRGQIYVCETFRQNKGVLDNRQHSYWVDDDLASRSVEDRLAVYKKHLGKSLEDFRKYDDRIRIIKDTDGDGRADTEKVFASGFNGLLEGTGAGVLSRGNDVYYACIPNLWKLSDTDNDDVADQRISLHYGFGVRIAFRGHDLHGLVMGPDGKLYFSIGDRGYNIKTPSGRVVDPESGAVFCCNLDGSDLEVIATGFRNPQELVFDDYGNLFTCDNNSDKGEVSRWVYVVEGGDCGWRMAYQYLPRCGPWLREGLWRTSHPGQPAFIVPPVANIAAGPAGVTFYPGTGMPENFAGRFFLSDFRGTPDKSGIWSFRVRPQGAFFELYDRQQPVWNVLTTDVDFGPDGALYVVDWVEGWEGSGKGRIHRVFDPEKKQDQERLTVQRLLKEGLGKLEIGQTAELLAHADRRVRQESQFELASRGGLAAIGELAGVLDSQQATLPRIHAVWGLGQIASKQPDHKALIATVLSKNAHDRDDEVRAQIVRLMSDLNEFRGASDNGYFEKLLNDESPRVRYFAAIALGKVGTVSAAIKLADMLELNAGEDPILRHGGVMALAGIGQRDPDSLLTIADHSSAAVRMAVLLALRRLKRPEVAKFLDDVEQRLVVEAARAIHDVPIETAMSRLAEQITSPLVIDPQASDNFPYLRRILNANFRAGKPRHADALAAFAAYPGAPEEMRIEALDMLSAWENPSPRDRVLGMWRPLEKRESHSAVVALKHHLPGIVSSSTAVRHHGSQVAAELGIVEVTSALLEWHQDPEQTPKSRGQALLALAKIEHPDLSVIVKKALSDEEPSVRSAARRALFQLDPEAALMELNRVIGSGQIMEQQDAFELLGGMQEAAATEVIAQALNRLVAGDLSQEVHLDLLQAAEKHKSTAIAERIAYFRASKPVEDPLAEYRETLVGGDAERGRRLFFEKVEVSCVRCHKVDGRGGEVGPDLSIIPRDKTREYLLESLVTPSSMISESFRTCNVELADGRIVSGVLAADTPQRIELRLPDGKLKVLGRDEIEEMTFSRQSAMPDDLVKNLSKTELR